MLDEELTKTLIASANLPVSGHLQIMIKLKPKDNYHLQNQINRADIHDVTLIFQQDASNESFSAFDNGAENGKKEHRCFPVNFAKFLRTPFLTEHLR